MAPSVIARIAASGDAASAATPCSQAGALLLQEQRLGDLARVHLPDRLQLRLLGGSTGAMLEGRQPVKPFPLRHRHRTGIGERDREAPDC